MHKVFSGGNESSARFQAVLRALTRLKHLARDSSERQWDSGTWPYNSEHSETITRFFEEKNEVVSARYEHELCHGTMDDDDFYEIRVLDSKSELVEIISKAWEQPEQ